MADDTVTWRDRAFPDSGVPLAEVGAQGWNLLKGDFHLPVAALRETAIERNLALMRDYCRRHDVLIAPHAKTTMSPALVERQLAVGAWGVTVANVQQARVFIAAGVRSILIANPVVGPADLASLAVCQQADPELQVLLLVDSVETVAVLADRARAAGGDLGPQRVMIELGYVGGRGGCAPWTRPFAWRGLFTTPTPSSSSASRDSKDSCPGPTSPSADATPRSSSSGPRACFTLSWSAGCSLRTAPWRHSAAVRTSTSSSRSSENDGVGVASR